MGIADGDCRWGLQMGIANGGSCGVKEWAGSEISPEEIPLEHGDRHLSDGLREGGFRGGGG